jgi:hypothetical protein
MALLNKEQVEDRINQLRERSGEKGTEMNKFKFIIEKESLEAYTVYWRIAVSGVDPRDDDNGERSKDFETVEEARKFADNLTRDHNVINEPRCEYRKLIDLSKPLVTYRSPVDNLTRV